MKQNRISGIFYLALLSAVLSLSIAGVAEARKFHRHDAGFGQIQVESGQFDYYLLALSWSPEFCGSPAGARAGTRLQCSARLGFVVHGLWPQLNHKPYPHDCGAEADIPADVAEIAWRSNPPMPPGDMGLLRHEWSKHGTCSGLGMGQYFSAVKASAEKVKIPEKFIAPQTAINLQAQEVVEAFAAANPGLQSGMINVDSDRQGNISAIQICFTKQLVFQSCPDGRRSEGGKLLPVVKP